MHLSTSAISALHIDPSLEGIFIMRSRLLVPKPQVVLHGSHSSHSVITQLLGAAGMTKPLDTSPLFNEFAINDKLKLLINISHSHTTTLNKQVRNVSMNSILMFL